MSVSEDSRIFRSLQPNSIRTFTNTTDLLSSLLGSNFHPLADQVTTVPPFPNPIKSGGFPFIANFNRNHPKRSEMCFELTRVLLLHRFIQRPQRDLLSHLHQETDKCDCEVPPEHQPFRRAVPEAGHDQCPDDKHQLSDEIHVLLQG